MNRSYAVKPAASSAAGTQRKAKKGSDAGILRKAKGGKMPEMGGSEDLAQLGKPAPKDGGDLKVNAPEVPAPAPKPVKTAAKVNTPKGPTSQGAAAKASKEMANQQVKKAAGKHQAKGGTGKPAPNTGGGKAPKAQKTSPQAKANAQAVKADQAKSQAAAKQADVVKAQGTGKPDPGKNMDTNASKAAEGAKAAAAAEKGGAGAKKPDEAKKDTQAKKGADAKGQEEKKKGAEALSDISKKDGGKGGDASIKKKVEEVTGKSIDAKVHKGPEVDKALDAIDAKAATQGKDVFLGKDASPQDEAHEYAHVAQNEAAGGSAAPAGSISEPSDPAEKEADEIAEAAMGGGSAGKAPSGKAAKTSLKARSSAAIQRAAAGAASKGGDEEKNIKIEAGGKTVTIKAKKSQTSATANIDGIPGLSSAKVTLKLKDGNIQSGKFTAKPSIKGLTGVTVTGNVSKTGKVSVKASVNYSIAKFARGKVTLGINSRDGLWGRADISSKELTGLNKLVQITDAKGFVKFVGKQNKVTAEASAKYALAGGKLKGDTTFKYDGSKATAALNGEVNISSFKPITGGKPIKYTGKYEDGKISANATIPWQVKAAGLDASGSVTLKYDNGKFSGEGKGKYSVQDFVSGDIKAKILGSGNMSASLTLKPKEAKLGPVEAKSLKISGRITSGKLSGTITARLSAFDGKASGSLSVGLSSSGVKVNSASLSAKIPYMKSTKITVKFNKGWSATAKVEPQTKALTGSVEIKGSSKGDWSGKGDFNINVPMLKSAKVHVEFKDGKFSGSTKIEPGAINIPNVTIKNSSIEASFGEKFSVGGSAEVSLAGGKVQGNLDVNYTEGKGLEAKVNSQVNIPGLNPVELNLDYKGSSLSGSAKTTLNIPYAKKTEVEVTYKDGKFGGSATVDFDIPYIKNAQGKINITPEGKVDGSLQITGNDINIAPLKVQNPTIKGEVKDGKLSISGGGTVTGIPGTKDAKVEFSMKEGKTFTGKIDATLKVPAFKEAKLGITISEQGIKGSASLTAEAKGFTGALKVNYDDGKFSGSATLGYKKGKFDGKVTVNMSEEGKVSGKGQVSYQITKNFKVTADVEFREDGTMKIGGKLSAPSSLELFKKEFKKRLVSFNVSFPIWGVKIPVVGNVGIFGEVGGGADIFAGVDLKATNITVSGSFDTATDEVQLNLGGKMVGSVYAGVGLELYAGIGLGVGPASISGRLTAKGEARIEGNVGAGFSASYNNKDDAVTLDVDFSASAGLKLNLGLYAGVKYKVDAWIKTWEGYVIGPKTIGNWGYDTGVKLDYTKKFPYKLGSPIKPDQLKPDQEPKLDGKQIAKAAAANFK